MNRIKTKTVSLSRLTAPLKPILFLALCAVIPTLQAQQATEANPPELVADNAGAWLAKMSGAVSALNFQASFVVLKPGTESQPYLWRHGVSEQGVEMEQLSLLNGPGKEVLRIGQQVSYFEPNVPPYSLQSETINGPLPSVLFDEPASLYEGYDFIIVGRSRIAGRAAQQIRIVSKDKNRFGFSLWLDQETGLLLKLNMVDLKGQLVEQIQVTELQVTESPHPYFSRIEPAKLPEVLNFSTQDKPQLKWTIDFMPQGMEVVKQDIHRLPMTGSVVEYMMLSDGLVDVSVYLQENSAKQQDDVLLRHESNTYLSLSQGPLAVTVIGKIPAQTANAIASSIRPIVP